MRLIQSAILAAAVFTLAAGAAWAADKSADKSAAAAAPPEERTFAELDKNNNRFISRAEAAADPVLAKDFDKFDLNHDGKLSRAEYFAARGKEDPNPPAKKLTGKDKANKPASGSASNSKQ